MRVAARAAVCSVLLAVAAPRALHAQRWNDPRTDSLVRQAIAVRAEQLADTALVSYHATAHGYVTFLAQVGQGFTTPPKVVKADELVNQVYWHAPNLSKQIIEGRRDTLLLPTDIQYHRDHLGIVQNNFPDVIRIGDGDEVRDVPHPLSVAGLAAYDFAIADSLAIGLPGRTIHVYEVKVRPKDDRQPRVVGAVYIDHDDGRVVRMAFNFTHGAFLDAQLEDLAVVLENGLIGGRFWLPSRQEIEIRRTATWMDYPVRGIIRGRWEIGDYELNLTNVPLPFFRGPEIVQRPDAELKKFKWQGRILDSLPPDVRAVTDADVARVQSEARELVRAQALERAQRATLSARNVSDFVRVDRVEGIALGFGMLQPLGNGFAFALRGHYGLADHEPKGLATFAWRAVGGRGGQLFASSELAEAGIAAERSRVVNSLAAQEFGSDYTDPYRRRAVGATLDLGRALGVDHHVTVGYEWRRAVDVHATPAAGRFEPTLAAPTTRGVDAAWSVDDPAHLWLLGTELELHGSASAYFAQGMAPLLPPLVGPACIPIGGPACGGPGWAEASGGHSTILRGSLDAAIERPFGNARLVSRTIVGAVRASAWSPPESFVWFGGPTTAPGYDFHSLAATAAVSQRLELRLPLPFVPVPLGRFGRSPASATLAPFVSAAFLRAPGGGPALPLFLRPGASALPASGGYPSVGVGLLSFFQLVRLDVARGLRDGRWTFSADLSREFWQLF